MANPVKIPQPSIDRIVRLYESDISSIKIAKEYGISSTTVRRILREQGVTIKGKGRYATA